jgi:hypothetical protein
MLETNLQDESGTNTFIPTIGLEKNIFKVYAINKYAGKTKKFIENGYEEYSLKELKKILKIDNGYHLRIQKNNFYILFGDCDGYKDNNPITFFNLLISFFNECYKIKITLNDISYTINKSKVGSYHYSIPKYYASTAKLKEIHENFFCKYSDIFNYYDDEQKLQKVIDTTIYTDKWFRYPNQTKEGKAKSEHIIEKGKIQDFIVEHIPKDSICIEDYKYTGEDYKSVKTNKQQNKQQSKQQNKTDEVDVYENNNNTSIKNYDRVINLINIDTMKLLINCLDNKHFLEYESWRDIIFICYNCNNDDKIVDFLTERSRIGKYVNISRDEISKQFYSNSFESDFNKLVLYSYARKDNKDNLYDKYFGNNYDNYKFEYDTIDMKHLKYSDIKNNFICDKNKTKLCVIKSRYGSGKTTFIKNLIKKEYSDKRVIFLTMRQSLARNLNKDFKELGFLNYLDKSNNGEITNMNYENDKIIISLDSIKKITYMKFMKLKIKPYDLVICDEFCSLLSHFDYDKLQDPELIHKIFESIIKNSTQTFFLDGDISNREILYLQTYFDYKDNPLFNINTGDKYNINISYDADKYLKNISIDLENNKKICVVSMSSNFALDIYNRFVNDYKCIVIYGKTDDKVKSKLEDVEDLFIKYDLVIYSPTITVGVDFNIKYFDKIYGYMCMGSVCPRVFFQMIFRVRQITDNNILILADNKISMKSWSNIIPFEEIKLSLYGDDELNSYQYIRLCNRFENMNSNLAFLNIFTYFCKLKNFDLCIDNKIINGYNKKKVNYNVIDIYNANTIDKNDFNKLMINIKNNNATKEEKISVEKYIYIEKFDLDIDKMEEKDFKKYYQKIHVLKGFLLGLKERNKKQEEHLIKNMKVNHKRNRNNDKLKKKYENFFEIFDDITSIDENYYTNCFDQKIIEYKHKYYLELIDLLELNDKKLDRDDLIKKFNNIYEIINNNEFRMTFNMGRIDKQQLYEDGKVNTKLLLGKLNGILDNFGIQMKSFKSGDNDNRKYYYKLEPLNFLPKKYIEYFNFMYKSIYN